MKTILLKCPDCNQNLSVDEGRDFCFCQYCGAKVMVRNENEKIIRRIDEAKLKQLEMENKKLEMEQQIRLKELEMLEKERAAAEKKKKIRIKIGIVVAIIGLILILIGTIVDNYLTEIGGVILCSEFYYIIIKVIIKADSNDSSKSAVSTASRTIVKIELPENVCDEDYTEMDYRSVEEKFSDAGFTNITCVPMRDLSVGFFGRVPKSNEKISEIIVNGEDIDELDGKKFRPDANIRIYYHSLDD